MDCPYYEELQYTGETRIQAMISYYYYSGDDRLPRNAINLIIAHRLYPPFPYGILGCCTITGCTGMIAVLLKRNLLEQGLYWIFLVKYQQGDGSVKDMPYFNDIL